jgi:hypothetical protein
MKKRWRLSKLRRPRRAVQRRQKRRADVGRAARRGDGGGPTMHGGRFPTTPREKRQSGSRFANSERSGVIWKISTMTR